MEFCTTMMNCQHGTRRPLDFTEWRQVSDVLCIAGQIVHTHCTAQSRFQTGKEGAANLPKAIGTFWGTNTHIERLPPFHKTQPSASELFTSFDRCSITSRLRNIVS